MTGCYNPPHQHPSARRTHRCQYHGINADEMTLAEVVKQKDYATACYGKWHLGHHPRFLPTESTASTNTSACPTRTTCGRAIPPGGEKKYAALWRSSRAPRVIDADVTARRIKNSSPRSTPSGRSPSSKSNKDRPFSHLSCPTRWYTYRSACLRQVSRQEPARSVRRRRDGNRLVRRTNS